MLELIEMPTDKVVGLRVHGRIDTESYNVVLDVIRERLERYDKLRLYVELESIGGMSLEAFFEDLKFGLGNWRRFDREAIVSDRGWVQAIIPLVDRLFPTMEVKVFDSADRHLARQWVGG